MDFIGEGCAILASISWTVSNFAFQQNKDVFSPMMLNFAKTSVSTIVLIVVLFAFGLDLFPVADTAPYVRLMLSGICGIAIGDSFFLTALHELGARKTLLVETLAPPMTGIIAFIYYGTTISFLGWIGIGLTLYGLYVVVGQKQANESTEEPAKELLLVRTSDNLSPLPASENTNEPFQIKTIMKQICTKGILCGAAAMLCQSLGIVLASSVLTMGSFNPLCATFLRIAPSNFVLFPILKYIKKEKFELPRLPMNRSIQLVAAILFSTIVVIWMIQLSLQFTRPEISQTLIATSPLFGLLVSRFKGEYINTKQVVGSFVSVFGVFLIILV